MNPSFAQRRVISDSDKARPLKFEIRIQILSCTSRKPGEGAGAVSGIVGGLLCTMTTAGRVLTLSLERNGEPLPVAPSFRRNGYGCELHLQHKRYRRDRYDPQSSELFRVYTSVGEPVSFDLPTARTGLIRIRGTLTDAGAGAAADTNGYALNVCSVKLNQEALEYMCTQSGRHPPLSIATQHLALSLVHWRPGVVRCTITRVVLRETDVLKLMSHVNLRHLELPLFFEYYADRFRRFTARSGHVVTDEYGSVVARGPAAVQEAEALRAYEFSDYHDQRLHVPVHSVSSPA